MDSTFSRSTLEKIAIAQICATSPEEILIGRVALTLHAVEAAKTLTIPITLSTAAMVMVKTFTMYQHAANGSPLKRLVASIMHLWYAIASLLIFPTTETEHFQIVPVNEREPLLRVQYTEFLAALRAIPELESKAMSLLK